MTTSRRSFFYVDATGIEVSPASYKLPVDMIQGVAEPDPGGRMIDTIGWSTVTVRFRVSDGAVSSDTLWRWRVTLDGVCWTTTCPQLASTLFVSRPLIAGDHSYTFACDRFLAIEPYIVSWGSATPGSTVEIHVSLS